MPSSRARLALACAGALLGLSALALLRRRIRRAALLDCALQGCSSDGGCCPAKAHKSTPPPVAGEVMPARMQRALQKQAESAAEQAAAASPAPPTKKTGAPHLVTAPKGSRQPSVLIEPQQLQRAWKLELSIHSPSRLLRRDIELVFRPDLEAEFQRHEAGAASGRVKDDFLQAELLAIPTWQPSHLDLSQISDIVNAHRKELLQNFEAWADALRPKLYPYWSDVSCPVEGNAKYGTPTSVIYNELEGLTNLLKYSAIPVGCCGIVLHPQWGRGAYPVTLFTTAPLPLLQKAIAEVEREHAAAAADPSAGTLC